MARNLHLDQAGAYVAHGAVGVDCGVDRHTAGERVGYRRHRCRCQAAQVVVADLSAQIHAEGCRRIESLWRFISGRGWRCQAHHGVERDG